MSEPKKIYVFINGGAGTDWINGVAICEDGHCLAGHISSHEHWFQHDMGLTSDWKHDLYKAHCPDGYELIRIPDNEVHNSPELDAAFKLNQALAPAAPVADKHETETRG